MTQLGKDSTLLCSNLTNGKTNGIDHAVHVKVEAFEADLFERAGQTEGLKH